VNTITPEFEQAAFDEFTRVMGEAGVAAYRELVDLLQPHMATFHAAAVLRLTANDQQIFRAVAQRLHREAPPA
jgi:hypothetical protein